MDRLSPPKQNKTKIKKENQDIREQSLHWDVPVQEEPSTQTQQHLRNNKNIKCRQPGTAQRVCGGRFGQPNTTCQHAWSMHLPKQDSPPENQLLTVPGCITQSILLHNSRGWGSIVTCVPLSKNTWSFFVGKRFAVRIPNSSG